jgi:peptidoglycan hydrolase CwlO-like protein
MSTIENILKAADLISEIRKAFTKIENLENGQKYLADAVSALDKRVRELEAGLREAKAEIKFEAIKETQSIVNSVQGHLYQEIKQVAIDLNRLNQNPSLGRYVDRSLSPPEK